MFERIQKWKLMFPGTSTSFYNQEEQKKKRYSFNVGPLVLWLAFNGIYCHQAQYLCLINTKPPSAAQQVWTFSTGSIDFFFFFETSNKHNLYQ